MQKYSCMYVCVGGVHYLWSKKFYMFLWNVEVKSITKIKYKLILE